MSSAAPHWDANAQQTQCASRYSLCPYFSQAWLVAPEKYEVAKPHPPKPSNPKWFPLASKKQRSKDSLLFSWAVWCFYFFHFFAKKKKKKRCIKKCNICYSPLPYKFLSLSNPQKVPWVCSWWDFSSLVVFGMGSTAVCWEVSTEMIYQMINLCLMSGKKRLGWFKLET